MFGGKAQLGGTHFRVRWGRCYVIVLTFGPSPCGVILSYLIKDTARAVLEHQCHRLRLPADKHAAGQRLVETQCHGQSQVDRRQR